MQAPTNAGVAATEATFIRVAVVDDHAAIRSGLEAAIASEPGLARVGLVADAEQLAPLIYRARPGVVVVDYHLPRVNRLLLCRQIKADVLAPAVIVYSALADAALVIPTIVAGSDGLVDKSAPARELLEAIRCVSHGGSWLPRAIPELLQRRPRRARRRRHPDPRTAHAAHAARADRQSTRNRTDRPRASRRPDARSAVRSGCP